MEDKMILQVRYACGTCGQEIIEQSPYDLNNQNAIVEKKIWHTCSDMYLVPLQSYVEKVIVKSIPVEVPVQETLTPPPPAFRQYEELSRPVVKQKRKYAKSNHK